MLTLEQLFDTEDWIINEIFDNIDYATKVQLEQTRLMMWAIFQSQSRKKLDLDKVLKLPTDGKEDEKHTDLTMNDVEAMMARAEQSKKLLIDSLMKEEAQKQLNLENGK